MSTGLRVLRGCEPRYFSRPIVENPFRLGEGVLKF